MTSLIKPSENTIYSKVLTGISQGSVIMLCQTPIVTSLNRISVVCCYKNVPMFDSIKQIYKGSVDKAVAPSPKHFLRGISGHLTKETARISFKTSGIVLKPSLDEYFKDVPFGKIKSDVIFSGGLASAEMLINPADTIRTMWQAGEKIRDLPKGRVLSHLYKGSGANGLRQFGTWLGFPLADRIWSKAIDASTSLDSRSITGITVKSLPESFQITAPIWIFERLKNELQYHPDLVKSTTKHRYTYVFNYIRSDQGWTGFVRGFMPKVLSNYILIIGANYLLELGRNPPSRKLISSPIGSPKTFR